jgi:hypothetical protein
MSNVIIKGVLSGAVANNGTLDIAYPDREAPESGKINEGDFHLGVQHKLVMGGNVLNYPKDFGVTIDGTDITLTNKTGGSWASGLAWTLELQKPGKRVYRDDVTGAQINRMARADTFVINLGAPDTADSDGAVASQNCSAATGLATGINGAYASGGVATFDVPRNVVAAWTTSAVLTVTGYDEYGNLLKESNNGAGTSLAGKKAFKKITGIAVSADVTGLTVGSGDVLGLPVFLPSIGCILKELQDAAVAAAGTPLAGAQDAGGSTLITGDVRGTYDPSALCNGEINFSLVVALPDPGYLGMPQYAG